MPQPLSHVSQAPYSPLNPGSGMQLSLARTWEVFRNPNSSSSLSAKHNCFMISLLQSSFGPPYDYEKYSHSTALRLSFWRCQPPPTMP